MSSFRFSKIFSKFNRKYNNKFIVAFNIRDTIQYIRLKILVILVKFKYYPPLAANCHKCFMSNRPTLIHSTLNVLWWVAGTLCIQQILKPLTTPTQFEKAYL